MASTSEIRIEHAHDAENHQQEDWSGGKRPFGASYGKLMMWYFLLSDAFTFAGFLIAYGTLRFSMPTWPVPDFVFQTLPFGITGAPLIFVTIMTFVLIASSVTMVRAVQEGHSENQRGVVFWMLLTIVGGAAFLGCQAWEWTNLIGTEGMKLTINPFSNHLESGRYLTVEDYEALDFKQMEAFAEGETYTYWLAPNAADIPENRFYLKETHVEGEKELAPGDQFDAGTPYLVMYDHDTHVHKNAGYVSDVDGTVKRELFGPIAFGSLFYFITGFHGFHVFSGLVFLLIICLNSASGQYAERRNGYEMVEKIGLYWHFVDLVWVFVFLVFYLL